MPLGRRGSTCEHNWIEDYDPGLETACYNDGLNYTPSMLVCTGCVRKKRKPRTSSEKRDLVLFILFLPLMIVAFLLFGFLLPIVLVFEELARFIGSKKASQQDQSLSSEK